MELKNARIALKIASEVSFWRKVKEDLNKRDEAKPLRFSSAHYGFAMVLEFEQVMVHVDAQLKEAEDKLSALGFEYDESVLVDYF